MTDALTQALANAAANTPKGEELHLENLESIANPESSPKLLDVIEQFTPSIDYIRESMAVPEFKTSQSETVRLKRSHFSNFASPDYTDISYISIDSKLNQVIDKSNSTNLRLDALADMISEVSTTISKAAQSMPSTPDHKHRSLDEWGDSTLLNELVERENDLMPFYYELLKRIGSPELQSLVMSSMQGKNASMVTLAQLCSALAPKPAQPQPISGNTTLIPNNPVREKQKQAEALLNQNMLSEEQQNALSDEDYHNWAVYMNHLCEESTVMMRFPLTRNYEPIKWNRESVIPPQQVPPQQQYFGQATEEYIRQTNNRIAP